MEGIKLLLKYGALAPSSHNSQPWAFKIGENYLEIYADFKRWLKESDKECRMIFTALGCLITNLKIAADHFGFNYDIEKCATLKVAQVCATFNVAHFLVAKINFYGSKTGKNADRSVKDIFQAISKRRSNRNRYKEQAISEADINGLKNLNKEESLKIDIVTDKNLKSKIAEISSEAMGKIMSDKNFRKELASWLRTNWTLKKDGMPGNGHGMSLPVSFIAPFILRHVDVSKVEAKKEKMRILNFPAVGIISSKENNPENWLKTGELLEMVLLASQSKGIDSAIRVASIEFPESREKLRNVLDIGNFTPQMLFGLGYAEKEAPHSPRRDINEVII